MRLLHGTRDQLLRNPAGILSDSNSLGVLSLEQVSHAGIDSDFIVDVTVWRTAYAWRAFQTSFSCGIVHRWPLSRTGAAAWDSSLGEPPVDAVQWTRCSSHSH